MEFNKALELNERNLHAVVKEWNTLRGIYSAALKSKGAAEAAKDVGTWLGGMESTAGINNVKDVVARLQAGGRKLDIIDTALIKLANSFIGKSKMVKGKSAEKSDSMAARKKEIQGSQWVDRTYKK